MKNRVKSSGYKYLDIEQSDILSRFHRGFEPDPHRSGEWLPLTREKGGYYNHAIIYCDIDLRIIVKFQVHFRAIPDQIGICMQNRRMRIE
jgi:hypothetical protein